MTNHYEMTCKYNIITLPYTLRTVLSRFEKINQKFNVKRKKIITTQNTIRKDNLKVKTTIPFRVQQKSPVIIDDSWFWNLSNLVVEKLYPDSNFVKPVIKKISLIIRPFKGVAYTVEVSSGIKEIHVSKEYILSKNGLIFELTGLVVHELTHVWQNNGKSTAPSGLIEGIADFIRLQSRLAPGHWNSLDIQKWDQGYEKTAYFLLFISTHNATFVQDLNQYLKSNVWDENVISMLTNDTLQNWFKRYKEYIK